MWEFILNVFNITVFIVTIVAGVLLAISCAIGMWHTFDEVLEEYARRYRK